MNLYIFTNHTISSNDIAVLELAVEVDLDTYTPACLAKQEDKTTFDDKPAEVYGWGSLVKQPNENGTGPEYPDTLQEVTLGVVTHEECAEDRAGNKPSRRLKFHNHGEGLFTFSHLQTLLRHYAKPALKHGKYIIRYERVG